jgi:Protein of unknown function (DUF3499)
MAATDTTDVGGHLAALPCARVGCSEPATASFAFDASSCLVWLDPLTGPNQGAGLLCDRHADRLTPPWGWNLQDRRTPTPRLWADRPARQHVPASPPDAIAGVRRAREPRARPCTAAGTETRLPFDEALPAPPADRTLARVLDARTPLLARAFEGARYPHRRDETQNGPDASRS